jgi:hypothetical protein
MKGAFYKEYVPRHEIRGRWRAATIFQMRMPRPDADVGASNLRRNSG